MSIRFACIAAVAWVPGVLHAQVAPSERIEVEGRYEEEAVPADAASQGRVGAARIESRPLLRPAELLEFVPGLIVTQHSGDGKANQYFLRGFNLDHGTDFATWVDGMPVNMPTHAHGQGYADLNFLIPEVVERIDYVKGPYFASEGDFSSAGAAHVRSAERLSRSLAQLTAGGDGYRRGVFAGSRDIGAGTLLGALEAASNDGPWTHPERLRKWSGVLRYSRGGREDGWSASAMGYEARWNSTDQVPLRAVAAGTLDRFGAIDPSDGGSTGRYSVSAEGHRASGDRRLEWNVYAIRSRLDLFSNFTYFLDHPADLGDPVAGDQFEQREQRTVMGGTLHQTWASQWGAREVTTMAGLQVRRDALDPVGLYGTVRRGRYATTREDRVREGTAGAYLENVVRWMPGLRTIVGARYDDYRFDVRSDDPRNSGVTRDHIVSPKAGAVLGPWARTELYANWGRGFHSNDARGATLSVDPGTGSPAGRVTPLVRSTGMELGLRARPLPDLEASLAAWQLDLASELVFAGDAGTTEASRPSRRRGIEWSVRYSAGQFRVDFDLSASRARFTDADPAGDYIPGAVDTVGSLALSAFDLGPWSGAFELRHFGPRPLVEDGSVRSKATTLANARISRRIGRDWRVSLDVFNLFDRAASDIDYYYVSRLPGEPAGGEPDIHFHPVEPRSLRLTATLRF